MPTATSASFRTAGPALLDRLTFFARLTHRDSQ